MKEILLGKFIIDGVYEQYDRFSKGIKFSTTYYVYFTGEHNPPHCHVKEGNGGRTIKVCLEKPEYADKHEFYSNEKKRVYKNNGRR